MMIAATEGGNARSAQALMGQLRERGVQFWIGEGGILKYRAPKGVMGRTELEFLGLHRENIADELRRLAWRRGSAIQGGLEIAPLSFPQLGHWNTYSLGKRRSACIIPLAIRLKGRVCVSALRDSALEVIGRHGALRTKIEIRGEPVQSVAGTWNGSVAVEKVSSGINHSNREGLESLLLSAIPDYIDVTRDALSGVCLFTLDVEDCVVLMYMEHIISDGLSLTVAVRDLLSCYKRALRGASIAPDELPLQYVQYAHEQRTSQEEWLANHAPYITRHFNGCGRVRIPAYGALPEAKAGGGWGVVNFLFDANMLKLLQVISRRSRTTVVMSTFVAYTAFVMKWCEVSDMVLLLQCDGRARPGCEESIGYYAFPLYLRICLDRSDTLMGLTTKVIDEYCMALEHADYGWMECRVPRPEFTRNTCFNWLPRGKPERAQLVRSGETLSVTEVPIDTRNLPRLDRDTEPMMGIVGAADEIAGGVYFPRDRFRDESMQRFVAAFLRFASTLWMSPEVRISDTDL